jgi:hypothetical protein
VIAHLKQPQHLVALIIAVEDLAQGERCHVGGAVGAAGGCRGGGRHRRRGATRLRRAGSRVQRARGYATATPSAAAAAVAAAATAASTCRRIVRVRRRIARAPAVLVVSIIVAIGGADSVRSRSRGSCCGGSAGVRCHRRSRGGPATRRLRGG